MVKFRVEISLPTRFYATVFVDWFVDVFTAVALFVFGCSKRQEGIK